MFPSPRSVLVVGVFGHMDDTKAFSLFYVRASVLGCERTPFFSCNNVEYQKMHLTVVYSIMAVIIDDMCDKTK